MADSIWKQVVVINLVVAIVSLLSLGAMIVAIRLGVSEKVVASVFGTLNGILCVVTAWMAIRVWRLRRRG